MNTGEQIRAHASRLRLYTLPRIFEAEAHLAREQQKTYAEYLRDVLAREVEERESKDLQRRMM